MAFNGQLKGYTNATKSTCDKITICDQQQCRNARS